jgi:hypothetical protein
MLAVLLLLPTCGHVAHPAAQALPHPAKSKTVKQRRQPPTTRVTCQQQAAAVHQRCMLHCTQHAQREEHGDGIRSCST